MTHASVCARKQPPHTHTYSMRAMGSLVQDAVRVAVGGVFVGFFLLALGRRRRALLWIALRRTWRRRPSVAVPATPPPLTDDDEESPPSPSHAKQA